MTQSYNLSQLANNINTAGQLDATDGLVGAVPLANGGTGQTTAATAGAALGAIGVGQTWQNLTGSRVLATTYTNSTGRPIMINVGLNTTTANTALLTIGSLTLAGSSYGVAATNCTFVTGIIPSGSTYSVTNTGSASINQWLELR